MGLFNGFSHPAQEIVAEPIDYNHLASIGADAIAAAVPRTMQLLDYLPAPAEGSQQRAATTSNRLSRTRPMARRYQLNVRLNREERDALRNYAKRHRLGIGEAVRLAIARIVAPQ
jgi:hypothetical protein